jgi:hypothetical protein
MPAASGAGNLGHLMATIGADITQLRADMAAATKLMQDASDKMANSTKKVADGWKKVGKEMKSAGKTMSLAITTPLIAAATYAFKQASDSAEWLNRVNVAFKSSSKAVQEFSTTTLKSIGLASITTMEYTGMIGDMATSMGLTTAAAAQLSIGMVDLAGDMSSLKNMEIGRVMEALTGIFTGQIRPLRALGVIMTVAAIKTYMLSQGITKQYKDLTQAELIMIRYNYILSVTKNSQGDFARTFNLAANQMRLFGQNLKEVALAFGNVLLPKILPVIVKINEFLTWVTKLDTASKEWIVTIGGLAAATGPLLLVLGYLIVNVFPGLVLLTAKVSAAFVWMGEAIAATSIIMAANPYAAFAAAMLAIISAFYLWNSQLTESDKLQKRLKKTSDDATRGLKEEQAAQVISLKLAMEYKEGTEGRYRALKKIQTIYPELLGNLEAETATNEQLNKILTQVNDNYKLRIELAAKEAQRKAIFEEQVANEVTLNELLTKREKIQANINKQKEIKRFTGGIGDFLKGSVAAYEINQLNVALEVVNYQIKKAEDQASLLTKSFEETKDPVSYIEKLFGGWNDKLMEMIKMQAAATQQRKDEAEAAATMYQALGIIGRLEFDLKQAKEDYTAAQSEADQALHQRKIKYIEIELKRYEDSYAKMTKLKSLTSEGGKLVSGKPQIQSSFFDNIDKQVQDGIKEKNKEAIEYSMKLKPTSYGSEDFLFWDDYETQILQIQNLQDTLGNDLSLYDYLSDRINLINSKLQQAIGLYGANSEEVRWLSEEYKNLIGRFDELNETMDTAKSIGGILGDAFTSMGAKITESFDLAKDGWEGFIAGMSNAVFKILGMLLANAIAQVITNSAQAAFFTGPAAPFTLPVFIAEGVGAIMTAFSAIPKFKDGAIAYGPTMGIMGEYPGARSNPEVIAPLDQLQKLMNGNGGSDDITVHGRLIGEDLYISNQRYNKRKTLVQ